MPQYVTENGQCVNAADPHRGVWYGWCTYWTDDWSKLKTLHLRATPSAAAFLRVLSVAPTVFKRQQATGSQERLALRPKGILGI
jgi:hypothetical protein